MTKGELLALAGRYGLTCDEETLVRLVSPPHGFHQFGFVAPAGENTRTRLEAAAREIRTALGWANAREFVTVESTDNPERTHFLRVVSFYC